jgi:predicted phosphodiesterase
MIDPKKPLSKWTLEEMEELYEEQGSFRGCARITGTTHGTWIRYYREKLDEKERMKGFRQTLLMEAERPKEKISPALLSSAMKLVQDGGYFCTKKPLQRGYTFNAMPEPIERNTYKVGLVSDTHLCSSYQQLDSLWKFYETCDNQGVDTVLHAGDISDGYKMYAGHEFELFKHGERAQTQYIIENYPLIDGIKTHFIGGNHDESFHKKFGSDLCYDVSVQRPDILYRGFYLANINIHGINVCLHHGDGGVAYARSYRPQRLALSKIENKGITSPDCLIIGHYHCSCILPDYIGMYTIQMPCFQAATPSYMGRKGLNPDIGGIILEMEIENNKLISTKTQYINYKVKEDDY